MSPNLIRWLAFWVFVFFGFPVMHADAQWQGPRYEHDHPDPPTTFRPIDPPLLAPERVVEFAKSGDPRVIPVAMVWLQEYGHAPDGDSAEYLRSALEVFMRFRVEEAAPVLDELLRKLPKNPALDREVKQLRDYTALAMANTRSRINRKTLRAAVTDYSITEFVRCSAAAALIDLDDDVGRIYLTRAYAELLARMRNTHSWDSSSRKILMEIYDPGLIVSIKTLDDAGWTRRNYNNRIALTNDMERLNRLSLDKARKQAADYKWQNVNQREEAIRVLGARGTPEDVGLLQNLRRWDSPKWGPDEGPNRDLREKGYAAANQIRRRYWRPIMVEMNRAGWLGARPAIVSNDDQAGLPLDVLMGVPYWVETEEEAAGRNRHTSQDEPTVDFRDDGWSDPDGPGPEPDMLRESQ